MSEIDACHGKVAFNRETAKVAARRQRKKGHRVAEYRCPYCRKWHVGSPEFITGHADRWKARPDRERDRPTPERKSKGTWVWTGTRQAGVIHPMDVAAHPIDALEHSGQLSNEQASAGRDFEALWNAAKQTPGIRDSTTLWEPKGHESDDGNIEAVTRYRELARRIGMLRDRQLIWVCVYHNAPRNQNEIAQLREALNEAARFFAPKGVARRFSMG